MTIKNHLTNLSNTAADIRFETQKISRDSDFLTLNYPQVKPRDDSYDFSMPAQSEAVIEAIYNGYFAVKFHDASWMPQPVFARPYYVGPDTDRWGDPDPTRIRPKQYIGKNEYTPIIDKSLSETGYLYHISEVNTLDGKTKITRKFLNYYSVPIRVSYDVSVTGQKITDPSGDVEITQSSPKFLEIILPPYQSSESTYKEKEIKKMRATKPSRSADIEQIKTLEYVLE